MKVCRTCCHWSKEFKGLCRLTQKGVGEMWRCSRWEVRLEDEAPRRPEAWKVLPN